MVAESSVLFSLKELRRLEDERVKGEADARKAEVEAERRAKLEAEQRVRDEEARRLREEEDRRRRVEDERQARLREDRLRVEEAERRARVEGELQLKERLLLEEQRQRTAQGRHLGRSAWIAAMVGGALFVAVGGGLAAWVSRLHRTEKETLQREIARRGEEARAAQASLDAKIRDLEERARRALGEAKTAKDQARILSDLKRQKQAIEATRPRPPSRPAPAAQPPVRGFGKPHIDETPLGGLPGTDTAF
jgi:hypothetical protein